jgi:hypothetical protein
MPTHKLYINTHIYSFLETDNKELELLLSRTKRNLTRHYSGPGTTENMNWHRYRAFLHLVTLIHKIVQESLHGLLALRLGLDSSGRAV